MQHSLDSLARSVPPSVRAEPRSDTASSSFLVIAALYHSHTAISHFDQPAGEGTEKRPIVRHGDHRALECLERCLKVLAPLDIEVIQWLVEEEEVAAT